MSEKTLPIFIKHEQDGIGSIHFPGEAEYEAIEEVVKSIAKDFYMSFEQAAETLGFELGMLDRTLVEA